MLSFLTFILGLSLVSSNFAWAQKTNKIESKTENKETTSDWALFKIGDEVYFSSDLIPFYKDFWTFHCAYPDAILFKLNKLKFTKDERDLIEKSTQKNGHEAKVLYKPLWEELKILLKLHQYVGQTKVSMKDNLAKEVLTLAKAENCRHRGKLTEKNLEKFLRIEIFLKSRFGNRLALETQKNANDKNENPESKAQDSAYSFLKTIERQVLHEDFY